MAFGGGDDLRVQEYTVTTVMVAILCLAWVTVSLRLWVRSRLTKSMGWDDAAMVLTLALFTVYCSIVFVLMARGLLSGKTLRQILRVIITYIQLAEFFYILSAMCLRIALGLFFLRVLVRRWHRIFLFSILGLSTVANIFYALLAIFQCGPPNETIENVLSGRGCISKAFNLNTGYVVGAISILADWSFVIVPLFMLRNAQLTTRSKISVGVIMILGAAGSVASAIRLLYLKGALLVLDSRSDGANVLIWSALEPGTGIAAGSLATLKPLVKRAISLVRTSTSNYSMSRRTHNGTFRNRSGFQTFDEESQSNIMTSVTAGPRNYLRASRNLSLARAPLDRSLATSPEIIDSLNLQEVENKDTIHKYVEIEIRTERGS